ncbi:NUDIX hydrolase [Williamsia sp. Leaf354]|uniref:NUDIX hydrolase n=1 Tax=Williamsia sp. Leaf354 TaxID=1736349 RepID=UPI0009EBC2F0|nr:NUDIX hydrolase [Williamsia sp. Leaf354]
MSAEPTEPNRDVAGHPRRRRGKRRGGRRRGSATATGIVAVPDPHSAPTDSAGIAPTTSGPAAAGSTETPGAATGGSRRGRRGRRRKPSRPTSDTPDNAVGGSRGGDGDVTVAVKPSDLRAAVRPAGRAPRSTPTDANADAGPRLRTVRETSAGGLVVSNIDGPADDRCAALIGRVDRRGRMMWSLPKGHIETGETVEQTAMREVAEETGIEGTVVASLGKIDYWFVSEGKRIHKTVHHYLMRSTGGELSDADYEVAEVAWVPLSDLPKKLTYSDERRLARAAADVLDSLTSDPELLARSEADNVRTEPNEYEKAAAARNQRRKEPVRAPRPRRRRRGPRRPAAADGSPGPTAAPAQPESTRTQPEETRGAREPRHDG